MICFSETGFHVFMKVRIDLGHCFRLMCHPEVVDVLQTTSTTEPRLAETLECVPAHSFLVQFQLDEARGEPAIFQVPVEMRCSVCSVKQQPGLPAHIMLQVLRNIRVQVDLSFGG